MIKFFSRGLNKSKLRIIFVIFFFILLTPTLILIKHAYTQLKWEAFHQHRLLAEEFSNRLNKKFIDLINLEEKRSFSDYSFLNVTGDDKNNILQRSPLSDYPPNNTTPGFIGYFQVDTNGQFSSPLLPNKNIDIRNYGIFGEQQQLRLTLQNEIQNILSQNQLVETKPSLPSAPLEEKLESDRARQVNRTQKQEDYKSDSKISGIASSSVIAEKEQFDEESIPAQAAFEQLNRRTDQFASREEISQPQGVSNLGKLKDLQLDDSYGEKNLTSRARGYKEKSILPKKRVARKTREALPETQALSPATLAADTTDSTSSAIKIRIFESEIDPFEFSLLNSGHFVLYRKVWKNGERYIQGMLFEQEPFLQRLIAEDFRNTALAQMSDLIIAYQGNVFSVFRGTLNRYFTSSAEELRGTLLYQNQMPAPFTELELVFNITRLPTTAAGSTVISISIILMLVIFGGIYLMYKLTIRQFELAQQQQNFVSAVSHELKTPLTSIRMYGEMLKEGWANEEKKKSYYDFIYEESERLSRLITNVLQLARMNRDDLELDIKAFSLNEVMDALHSKISSQSERAGFKLNIECSSDTQDSKLMIDLDALTQIIINLVDNAIKFSDQTTQKIIDINATRLNNEIIISVRDYGPGIAKNQLKKIFQLFYRSENELTRKTSGTGIGLALVKQLALAMDAKIDALNREPGAEFRITFQQSED